MKYVLTLFPLIFGTMAAAHPGHVAEVAGHTHWFAIGALVAAAVVVLTVLASFVRRHRAKVPNRLSKKAAKKA